MKSRLVTFLCKDCFSAFLGSVLVIVVVAFVAITCIAAQHRGTDGAHDTEISHSAFNTAKESLKKKDMEVEELLRSRELSLSLQENVIPL